MKKKRGYHWNFTSKQKKEVGLIIGSVLVVAMMGIYVQFFTGEIFGNFVGAAINPNQATTNGVLSVLNKYTPVKGNGACNDICGEMVCLPYLDECNVALEENQCYCVNIPK
jgi:hypothetical protein